MPWQGEGVADGRMNKSGNYSLTLTLRTVLFACVPECESPANPEERPMQLAVRMTCAGGH